MMYYTQIQCTVSHSITMVTPMRVYHKNYTWYYNSQNLHYHVQKHLIFSVAAIISDFRFSDRTLCTICISNQFILVIATVYD